MKKLDLDNKLLVFGKASFNSSALKSMTKEQFEKTFTGALRGQNMKEVLKEVSQFLKSEKVSKPKNSK